MDAPLFEETAFFRAIAASGARALLIGRRALVALGLPLLTADYDFWLHLDDIEAFNRAVEPFELIPSKPPDEARRTGRYVLENDEHVDVLLGRSVPTHGGPALAFDAVWQRREAVEIGEGIFAAVPALDDLIATKRFGNRPRDAEDIRLLEALRARRRP